MGREGWDYHQRKTLSIEKRRRDRRERQGELSIERRRQRRGREGLDFHQEKKKMVLSRRKRGTKEARGREKGENLTENLLIRQILTDSSRFRIPYMAPTMQLLVLRPNPIAVEWSIRDRCSCTSLTLGFLDFIKFEKNVCCMFSSVVSLHFSCV